MDPIVQQELKDFQPDVPFRYDTKHTHSTWARTFHSRPELYLQPETVSEVQKIVQVARRCRRRVVTVGCAHSPSDLTLTSSWVVNLDKLRAVMNVDIEKGVMMVQSGIRLSQLNQEANSRGLTIPNLGSIVDQSVAGALSTGTHGSTLRHGTIADKVLSLKIILGDGSVKTCSPTENVELFRAALLSLGALGIIVEVTYQLCPSTNIEWTQTLQPLSHIIDTWNTTLWTSNEFVRCWWLPYLQRCVVWSADKTASPPRAAASSWYGGSVGFHTYHILLRISNTFPSILPAIEWFVFGMQYGFRTGTSTNAVESMQYGLLMNCLYSQFVNEWAVPLSTGPEIISRLSAWINHRPFEEHHIPFSSAGLYVHAPIELRVSDTRKIKARPYLDGTCKEEPTLYLNATLYRPYLQDPPCMARYYQAFEWLMREYNGHPHWAKNFTEETGREYLEKTFGNDLTEFRKIRDEADPGGVFIGAWHRRNVLEEGKGRYRCEEIEVKRTPAKDGGKNWVGEISGRLAGNDREVLADDFEGKHRPGTNESSITGTKVFDKM
ncbi:putative D-arabinono-1,4-lactone oxidase [Elsinoe australis]|uniref:D-arabinono-1,4-lactone oxidase n=1 Tax=Elsinoe australis TaxID=40998 RepID=A0A4U7AWJ0_9PEZI|nr:putative D-arabinono-1,4-lactone oxidase [Elsinoe australis]